MASAVASIREYEKLHPKKKKPTKEELEEVKETHLQHGKGDLM